MKKLLAITFLLTTLILSGCFGFSANDAQKSAADENAQDQDAPVTTEADQTPQEEAAPQPPSFQDGDYYLKAVTTYDVTMCAKIGNAKLKERCETNAKQQ